MNVSLVSTAVVSLFMLAIILGFVFGWIRGFSKSIIRFFMVLGMAVLAFFVVPSITNFVLKFDISNLNINIGGVQVITVQELIEDLLRKIPIVEDLIHASPTLEAFIKFLPVMVANVAMFIVFFFVFKWISMIIYWIVAGIFFSKKKMAGKDKHKFIGAVIGAVQGILIACVCMVPMFGIIETAQPVIQVAIQENQEAEAAESAEAAAPEVYYAESETESEEKNAMIEQVEKVATEVDKYTEAFNNTWIVKVLNSVGVKKLSVSMFDNLTTVTDKGVTYSIRAEIKSVANVFPQVKAILSSGLDMEDNACLDKIKAAANELFDDEVFGTIIKEIVPYAAEKWYDGEKFCNISKPNINNVAAAKLFDAMLLKTSTDEGANVKNDVNVSIDILKICNNADLLKTMNDGGDMMDVFTAEGNENLIADIISKALESNTLKNVMPELVNFGLDVIYKALGEENAAEVTILAENINWEIEKPIIQNVFSNLIKIFADIDGVEDPLEALDFELMGETFDYLRDSTILKAGKKGEEDITSISQDLIKTLFESEVLGENAEQLAMFKDKLLEVWADETVSLKETFKALGDTLKVAKSLDNFEDLNLENLGDVIKTLAGDDTLKDIVTEIIGDTDTLKEMGVPEEIAPIVSETITKIINPDEEHADMDIDNEISALVEVFDVASQILSAGDGEQVEITADSASDLIDSIAGSSVILDLITDNTTTTYTEMVSELDITSTLSQDSKDAIEQALQENQNLTEGDEGYENKLTPEQLAALKALFGI